MTYKRQKFLLAILMESPTGLTVAELTGIAAILCNESSLFINQQPYEMIDSAPPLSLQLSKDIEDLSKKELLSVTDGTIGNMISPKAKKLAFELSFEELAAIKKMALQYGALSPQEKMKRAKKALSHKKQVKKSEVKPDIYTVGYEGESVDHFFQKLLNSGIEMVIDVRSNPISRKYGFSKKAMSTICKQLDIGYIHYPKLGIPSSMRRDLKSEKDYKLLLDDYEKTVLKDTEDYQIKAMALLQEKPSALLCFEADKNLCHRTRLAKHLAKTTNLTVRHI